MPSACSLMKSNRRALISPVILTVRFNDEYNSGIRLRQKAFAAAKQAAGCALITPKTSSPSSLPQQMQKPRRKTPLSIVLMNNQLRNPTHLPPFIHPAARKYITGQDAVDGDFSVRACGVGGKVFGFEPRFAEFDLGAFEGGFSREGKFGGVGGTRFGEFPYLLGGVGAPDAVVGAEEVGGFLEHGVCDVGSVVFFEEAGLHVRALISDVSSRLNGWYTLSSESGFDGELLKSGSYFQQ